MDLRRSSRHKSASNSSAFSEPEIGAKNSLNFNLTSKKFIDTYTIKIERNVYESCDGQIRNNYTNLQEIKSEPQFCIVYENDFMEENHRAPVSYVKIKTEAEDTAAEESCSNLHHVPFASIDNENLQDEDELQNELTSELIIKSENESIDVEESRDNNADSEGGNYIQDLNSRATENKTSVAESREKRKKSEKNVKFCALCEFTTPFKRRLRNHIREHAEPEFQIGRQVDAENLKCAAAQISSCACQICGRVFTRKSNLTRHLKIHGNKKINEKLIIFECEVCKKQFATTIEFKRHKKIHLNVNADKKCLPCDKEFKSKKDFNRHVKHVHEALRSFHCTHSQCSKSFKSKSDLKSHLNVHFDGVRSFKCDKCPKSFKLEKQLKRHNKYVHSHSEVRLFVCKKCGKAFKTKVALCSHGYVHTDERPFPCEVCGKTFKRKYEVKDHMTVHIKEFNFKCGQCDKMFKSKHLLCCHKRRSHAAVVKKFQVDVKKFHCALCNIKFTTKRGVTDHMSVHSDVRPFSCDICERSFKSKSNLNRHVIVLHTAIYFKCKLCDAKFKSKATLATHVKYVHSVAIPFKCNQCEKSYKDKVSLMRHIAGHLNLRQFKCDKCDRSFNVKSDVKRHSVVHSDTFVLYKCYVCESNFKQKRSLKRHIFHYHM